MKLKWSATAFYGLAIGIMLLLVSGRYIAGGFDFSYFMVGGTDFIDNTQTPCPLVVQKGQGYDGQFFYRYALDPFDFSKTNKGITVDHLSYRMQRLGYPLLAWILSFFGIPSLVPFALVLINIFAFIGIIYFTQRFIKLTGADMIYSLMPFFLCGIYMSVARDLSEVTELFFFLGAVYCYFKESYQKFAFFASLAVLCRETSLVAFIPIIMYAVIFSIRRKEPLLRLVWLTIPFFVFISWKWWISIHMPADTVIEGAGNLGIIPFKGILEGFRGNLDISTNKNILQLCFWILYFIWQLWLAAIVLLCIKNNFSTQNSLLKPLSWVYLTWLVFAIFLSAAIYVDDWSFLRVFSLWSITGFLILMSSKKKAGNIFILYSAVMVFLTLGRLIIRP